jgi:alpha-amylase
MHQPYRVKRYGAFSVGNDASYFNGADENDLNNRRVLKKVAEKSYLPTLDILLALVQRFPDFKIALSITGTLIDQLTEDAPEVIQKLQALSATGNVEFIGETYHHSLAFFYDREEFEEQVRLHRERIATLFHAYPRVFRNTELAYHDELGVWAHKHGYDAVLAEGWDPVLNGRSPDALYTVPEAPRTKLLLKNYRLSDDIAFRFGEQGWEGWPLTPEKFASWIEAKNGTSEVVNLFMDFETFGEHQWEATGIFEFLQGMVPALLRSNDSSFVTPSEALSRFPAREPLSMQSVVTWADTDRDLTAWTGNDLQRHALEKLYALKPLVHKKGGDALTTWRKLQTSDHFYYMCTKWSADGDVHAYFSPYNTPHEAHTSFMHALQDFTYRLT